MKRGGVRGVLWTFINEYKGGTYIAQKIAPRLYPAIEDYVNKEVPEILTLAKSHKNAIDTNLIPNELCCVEIKDTRSVWHLTLFDKKSNIKKSQDMHINIILTAET